jgi:hypothetical protein
MPRIVPGDSDLGVLGISEFVDGRLAILDQPQLNRDRPAVLAGDAEAQGSGLALLLGERAQERE